MSRREWLSGALVFSLAVVFAFAGTASAKNKGGKAKGDGNSFTGVVQSYSKTQIVLFADGDRSKTKAFTVDDKTTITGDIEHGVKATVSFTGNKATSISASE